MTIDSKFSRSRRVALNVRELTDRVAIFQLSGGVKRDPDVETWLSDAAELRLIAREWFLHMRGCGDDVRELMHDGGPVACVDDAAFGYVNVFKTHVNVGFFYGAFLDDPAGLLEGGGKRMRHVKLTSDVEPDNAALRTLITAAYLDIKSRLDDERASTS
jgi:hypothetical protein